MPWVLDNTRTPLDGRLVQYIHIVLFFYLRYAWLGVVRESTSLLVLSQLLPLLLFEANLGLKTLDLILISLMHNTTCLFLAKLLL